VKRLFEDCVCVSKLYISVRAVDMAAPLYKDKYNSRHYT
jgi:hypothetical protein